MLKRIIISFSVLFIFTNLTFAKPRRIISTMPSITEILFALNLGDRVVGVTQNCNYPPEALKKEKIGRENLNLEKIVSLKPDLIIMLEDAQKREMDKLKDHGFPVLAVNPHTISEVMDSIGRIGSATGSTNEASKIISNMKQKISAIEAGSFFEKKKTAFLAVGYLPLIGAGGHTFINDVIQAAGGKNILENLSSPYPEINFEDLYHLNPSYIIFPRGVISEKEMLNDPRWSRLEAVKNGKILFIDPDILFRPGPRIVSAIEEISKFLRK